MISTAESCTGGMIGNLITNIPGSSSVYKGGIIAYSIFSKEKIFNIDASFLKEYGAVNSKTVEIMAREALKIFDSDYAISVSGIAGPDTDEFNTPVGTVFFGIYSKNCDKIIVERKKFSGTREIVKRKASYYILIKLLKKLL
ncbi:MAG: hypothetical protein B6I29_01850 [Marinitoga sp. 4572_148]|nr:MAG: hypothetical protein B6I29_01850 [Marinitoga sp. 4572_148]